MLDMETVYQVSFLVSPGGERRSPRARQQRCVCFRVCVRRAGAWAFLAGGPPAADVAVGGRGPGRVGGLRRDVGACLTGGGNSLQTGDICVIECPVGTAAVAVNRRGGRYASCLSPCACVSKCFSI